MKNSDIRYFTKASYIARASDFKKTHVGCIAVFHGNVIGVGCNTNKTHTAQKYYNRYRDTAGNYEAKMHAEINCINQIRNLDILFSKVKLYIYRTRKDQPFGMSRPCPACMEAIRDIGIKNIYYTSNFDLVKEKII